MKPLTKKDFEEILDDKLTEQTQRLEKTISGMAAEVTGAVGNMMDAKFAKYEANTNLKLMDLKGDLRGEFVKQKDFEQHLVAGHK